MNTYRLLRAVYRPIDPVYYRPINPAYYRLSFELIRLIQAPTAEDALAEAKRLGAFAPVIELDKGTLQ